jgi:NAD(P)-dependent dehydrogenase (short-subunit alcohol dehydrogenase family)
MNPLAGETVNAVIAGGGAIGSALAAGLLSGFPVAKLYLLQRDTARPPHDPRIVKLPVDALAPNSLEPAMERIGDEVGAIHLVINTVGVLHGPGFGPEKRLADLEPGRLVESLQVNAIFAIELARAVSSLLKHPDPAIFASLSARVGSIEDNRMGGWYSYRASKAAHNMLIRNLANEWRLTHRNTTVLALHPGTVRSGLSEPFISPGYPHRVLSPGDCADALLTVLEGTDASDSGRFFDWQGEPIPW